MKVERLLELSWEEGIEEFKNYPYNTWELELFELIHDRRELIYWHARSLSVATDCIYKATKTGMQIGAKPASRPVGWEADKSWSENSMNIFVAKDHEKVNEGMRAHEESRHETFGHMLGIPSCCRTMFLTLEHDSMEYPIDAYSKAIKDALDRRIYHFHKAFSPVKHLVFGYVPCTFDCKRSFNFAKHRIAIAEHWNIMEESSYTTPGGQILHFDLTSNAVLV